MDLSFLFVKPDDTLEKVWSRMLKKNLDIVLVIEPQTAKLLGIVTYGDIRKALSNLSSSSEKIANIMNKKPITLKSGMTKKKIKSVILEQIKKKRGNKILLLDSKYRVRDIAYLGYKNRTISVGLYSKGEPIRKTILVTGGAGYLGSVLVRQLLEKGYEVVVLDSLYFGDESIKDLYDNPNFTLIKGSIENIGDLAAGLQRVHYVIHLAGIVGDPACGVDPLFTIQANYFATQVFIRMCRYYKIERFIFASSCSVYGVGDEILDENSDTRPLSLYARSKLEAEKLLLSESDNFTHVTIMRMATLHGWSFRPRFDLVANLFAGKAAVGEEINVQGGAQRRPLLHIKDAANAYTLALEAPIKSVSGEIFNVGSSEENYTILNLAEIVKKELPKTKVAIDQAVLDKRDYAVDFSKISKVLKFKTNVTLKQSIKEIVKNVKKKRINIHDGRYSNYLQALSFRSNLALLSQ